MIIIGLTSLIKIIIKILYYSRDDIYFYLMILQNVYETYLLYHEYMKLKNCDFIKK